MSSIPCASRCAYRTHRRLDSTVRRRPTNEKKTITPCYITVACSLARSEVASCRLRATAASLTVTVRVSVCVYFCVAVRFCVCVLYDEHCAVCLRAQSTLRDSLTESESSLVTFNVLLPGDRSCQPIRFSSLFRSSECFRPLRC